tara:strand:+ start:9469 stop:9660 length:192 start_codon:yes stop_codon:yes gene_type:complete
MAPAVRDFLGEAEVQTESFGVTNMEISIRLRGKSRDDMVVLAGFEVVADYLPDEVSGLNFGCL